ncbi:AMP-binding protein [Vibrio spartinae]|uniref:D-alanine--poly(Phosphoribitol) ligase subunit 1 n=1 Tax=Vibrio spartinae TaxID=1918945 RepID=A0A1N6M5G4_9VIBR|nr:AMP-binding protein [Vibrio spartinae]QMV15001.1 D-alanine--poly(phosphoribitol) ligase subunit 1 [Vibrio spartinae]SIO94597.1 D-alanine--poly(phosphoribitol) ligase subunit 1 [Vibrio spartinae]
MNLHHERLFAVFSAFRTSEGMAYHHVDGDLSYRQLFDAAVALAEQLNTSNTDESEAVLIYGHKNCRYLIAYWACILAGRIFVPVEPENSTERLRQIIASAQATLILDAHNFDMDNSRLDTLGVSCLVVEPETGYSGTENEQKLVDLLSVRNVSQATDTMYIMFSSGTTGQPKGIAVSYANVADLVMWLEHAFPVDGSVSGNIRYCFDVSLYELWLAWINLKPISALDHHEFINTRKYIGRHQDYGVTTWVSTPTITRYYLKDRQFCASQLPHLSHFIFCGEVLSKEMVVQLWERFPGCRVTNTYGPTECTVAVTATDILPVHVHNGQPLPLGRVRPGSEIRIDRIQEHGRGEIIIRGDAVGPGYICAPAKQQARFSVDPVDGVREYRTGDIGSLDGDMLYFWGRGDRECKIQGYRIDLNEVEAYLRQLDEIKEVFVEPWFRKDDLQGIRAFVLPEQESDFQQLAAGMADNFPSYMVPRFWYAIEDDVLNLNSKLDRRSVSDKALKKGNCYVFKYDAGNH